MEEWHNLLTDSKQYKVAETRDSLFQWRFNSRWAIGSSQSGSAMLGHFSQSQLSVARESRMEPDCRKNEAALLVADMGQ